MNLAPDCQFSVLVTARNPSIPFIADFPGIESALFTTQECVRLFSEMTSKPVAETDAP